MITEIFIENQKLDLFDDESISITQSVQDVKDISKIFADFSQSFNVPASKTNNQILKNWYIQDIDNGFDARTRKDAFININTIPFKTGKIQLNGAKLKDGRPTQYSLTFYGDVVKVKDLLGDDKLFDLDWLNNFDFAFSGSVVETGLTDGLDFTVDSVLYEQAVIYPLISYKRQYFYNSDSSVTTSTDTLVNIAWHSSTAGGVNFANLKPAIKLSLIIEAITQQYGINFVGGFFDSAVFNQIYMNLNKETEQTTNGLITFEDIDQLVIRNGSFIPNQFQYNVTITPDAGFTTTPYRIVLRVNDEVIFESPNFVVGTESITGFITALPLIPGGSATINFKAQVVTSSGFEFDATTDLNLSEFQLFSGATNLRDIFDNAYVNQTITLQTQIQNNLPDIKVYDFLVGLFKTFNLTVSPIDGNINVEDLITWYSLGNIVDITQYVDTREKEVEKGKLFNEIDFEFKESNQILANEFQQSNNRVYGNEELTLYTDDTETEKLAGETLKIESIFENPIYERLFDLNDDTITTIQYCPYFDREIKRISNNPFMFFVNSVDVSSNPIAFNDGGGFNQINTTVLMPTHSQVIDSDSFNLNFSAEINEYTGQVLPETIYARYWEDYVSDVFSVKRRLFKYKAILPLSILNNLKLNDRLIIGNTRFLINKITSELTKRQDTLELVNDIYDAPLQSDQLRTSLFNREFRNYNYRSQSDSVQYVGTAGQAVKKTDTGFDVTWVTIDSFENTTANSTVNFTLSENTSGVTRTMAIDVIDGVNDPRFLIIQTAI